MNVDDFEFELPDHLIAQDPPKERGGSRLLVLHRTGSVEHTAFANLAEYLVPGDLLVVNDTRVFPARLLGHRIPSGGGVECLLLNQLPTNSQSPMPNSQGGAPDPASRIPDPDRNAQLWDALVHPGQKLKPGARMVFDRDDVRID